jgi:hypothetical protein
VQLGVLTVRLFAGPRGRVLSSRKLTYNDGNEANAGHNLAIADALRGIDLSRQVAWLTTA